MSAKESDNYYRLITLVVKTGTRTIREVLKKHTADDIASVLKSHRRCFDQLNRKGVLTDPQYQLLIADTPILEKFDISLLVILIRNICTSVETPPGNGWKTVTVLSSDTTVGGYIIRIRNVRNKFIGHSSDTRVSNDLFKNYWAEAEKCLKELATHVDILHEISEEIKNTESMPLTADSYINLEATLKKWREEDNTEQVHRNEKNSSRIAKRSLDDEENTISGYIHSTTPVKQASLSNVLYFNGQIQTNDTEFNRFVSFNPAILDHFQSAQIGKKQVKLQNVNITHKKGTKEIIVNKSTIFEEIRTLKFEMKTEVPTANKQLSEIKTPGIMCSVNVKVVGFFDEEHLMKTKYGECLLRTAMIADQSGCKKMPLWSTNITKLKKDEFYKVTNVMSSMYEGEVNLLPTVRSTFSKIEPISNIQENIGPLGVLIETIGSVLSCRLNSCVICVQCRKTLSVPPELSTTKCDDCKTRQRVLCVNTRKTLHLTATTGNNENKRFVAFNDVVEGFLKNHNLQNKSDTEIEEFLLSQDQVTIQHKQNTDIMINIV